MGVYIYKSKHCEAIKIGHYKMNNAWSRIANRGFYSCKCPDEIKDKVSIEDLILLCWFPNLTPKDEKKLHRDLAEYSLVGEWFHSEAINKVKQIITEENMAFHCSKEAAMQTKRRL